MRSSWNFASIVDLFRAIFLWMTQLWKKIMPPKKTRRPPMTSVNTPNLHGARPVQYDDDDMDDVAMGAEERKWVTERNQAKAKQLALKKPPTEAEFDAQRKL